MSALFSNNLGAMLDEVDGRVIQRIPVDLIDPDPDQPRREIPQAIIEERGNSMAAEGQLSPIELVEKADGRYILVFGEVRWRGAVWKGLPDLEAIVNPIGMDPKKIRRRQLIENLQRTDMSALDTARGIERLVADEGSGAAAARAIGMSEGQISKYLSVLKLPPIAAQLAASNVTKDVETLTTVAKIERADPAAAQELMVEANTTGKLTRGRAREAAQAVAEAATSQPQKAKGDGEAPKSNTRAPAPAPTPTPSGSAKPTVEAVKPVKLKAGEQLRISVKVVETSRDAKRFGKAQAEHGEPSLYQGGVSRDPDRCWVLFGESPRAAKSDQVPRIQEFPCGSIVLGMVKATVAQE